MTSTHTARPLTVAVLLAAIAGSIATSPPPPTFRPFTSQHYLYNGSDETRIVRIRELRDDVELDCDAVAQDPGRLLDPALFGPVVQWEQIPNGRTPLGRGRWGADCSAARIDGDDQPEALLFWTDMELTGFDVESSDRAEPGARGVAQWWTDEGFDRYDDGGRGLIVPLTPFEPSDVCEPDSATHLDWVELPPSPAVIVDQTRGIDGCWSIEVDSSSRTWMVCAPDGAWPFEVGDTVDVLASPAHLEVISETQRLFLGKATVPVDWSAELEPSDCAPAVIDECGNVRRTSQLTVHTPIGEAVTLRPGADSIELDGPVVWLPNALQDVVTDLSCGTDLPAFEIAISQENTP